MVRRNAALGLWLLSRIPPRFDLLDVHEFQFPTLTLGSNTYQLVPHWTNNIRHHVRRDNNAPGLTPTLGTHVLNVTENADLLGIRLGHVVATRRWRCRSTETSRRYKDDEKTKAVTV
jgi:hypothetical protein